ncbi:MAG: hypothetical protein LBL95_06595 [Deltaproteobacteria bacterium]|nr:hypothetical protein [Deltaproteobacteria bacterium]
MLKRKEITTQWAFMALKREREPRAFSSVAQGQAAPGKAWVGPGGDMGSKVRGGPGDRLAVRPGTLGGAAISFSLVLLALLLLGLGGREDRGPCRGSAGFLEDGFGGFDMLPRDGFIMDDILFIGLLITNNTKYIYNNSIYSQEQVGIGGYRSPAIDKIKKFIIVLFEKYITIDNLSAYFAIIFSTIFIFYFIRDFSGNIILCNILSSIYLILLFMFTCKNAHCDMYKYMYLYLIAPALYCVNGTINRYKYVLLPPAALLLAFIFTYNFDIPVFMCGLFLAINLFYIVRYAHKYKTMPQFLPYLKQMAMLAVIAACGYIISLHLSQQFYFKAYKFMTSWF